MHILFVVHQFMPDFAGGTERVTLNLARAAQADGAHVEVLTVTTGDKPGWRRTPEGFLAASVEGVPITALPIDEPPLTELGFHPNPKLAEAAQRFLASRRPFDVAHVMHSLRMTEAVEALADRHVPYLVTVTDFFTLCYRVNLVRLNGTLCGGPQGGKACQTYCPQPQLGREDYAGRTERFHQILRRASAVVAVSDYVAERVRAEHPDLRLFVVPNGVDLLKFRPAPPRPADRPLTIGYLGTVSQAKGALMLAEGFAVAKANGVRLRMIGPCYEPATADKLAKLAAKSAISLEDPVPTSEVPRLLTELDVVAVPSQVPESFSLTLHEGFAAGVPALVSDLGNAAAVVRRTGAGLAVAGKPQAWAQAIRSLADNPDQLADWAKAAPLPWRIEEEAFAYSQLYRAARTPA